MWANRKTTGFTIVELLIVVVVIGILAAIVIVAYNGITNSARASAIQSDLASAKKRIELYKVENGTYPTSTTQLSVANIKASKSVYDTTQNNFYYCYNTVTDEFAIGARTVSSTAAYIISSLDSIKQVPIADGSKTCQAVGLTAWDDPNAFINNGHNSSGGWQSWVK